MSDASRKNQMRSHLKLVENLTEDETQDAVDYALIEVISLGLLQRWFPTKMPTDIEKWSEIAYEDAVAVITALKEEGYTLTVERTTNDDNTNNS
jgi:beta-glucosidase-like glycosyl hydrolase